MKNYDLERSQLLKKMFTWNFILNYEDCAKVRDSSPEQLQTAHKS